MRDLTVCSMVMVLAMTGCDGDNGTAVAILPDACATHLADAAPMPLLCGTASLGQLTAGVPVTGTTSTSTSSRMPTCAPSSATSPDVAYRFTAPSSGVYYFDSVGSMFNAVITVLDVATCLELQCASNPTSSPARAAVFLDAGQEVAVVVDGWNGGQGDYTLLVEAQPTCNPQVLSGALPLSATVTSSGTSRSSAYCGGSGPEATFLYTVPADGYYEFDTVGSSIDTQLYVRDDCYSEEYACDDNSAGSGAARLASYLFAGSTFEFVVDTNTAGGVVKLNISGPPPAPACPETALGSTSPQSISGTTIGAAAVMAATCGGAGPEKTYSFTAPASGSYRFTTSSSGDTVLYVRDGSCSGTQLACNDDDGVSVSSRVQVALTQGQTVVLVVDSYDGPAPFTLSVAGPL
jgi:hypothetical protein